MQSIPPTTADKQTQAQKRRGSRSRKLLGAKAKCQSYQLTHHHLPVNNNNEYKSLKKYKTTKKVLAMSIS